MTKSSSRQNLFSHLSDERIQLLIILALTGIAAGLRLYKLGTWSFWGDEMITVRRALDLWELPPARWSVSLMLTNLSLQKLGIFEWSARLVPAMVGILSIPVFYLFSRSLAGPLAGVVAAGLLAVSPWHIYWSQNARFYTPLLLFFVLAGLMFYLGLEHDRPVLMVLSALFLGLALLERLLALLFVPIAGLYVAALFTPWFSPPPGLRLRNLAWFLLPVIVPGIYLATKLPAVQTPGGWGGLFGWINTNPLWILAGVLFYLGIPTVCVAIASAIFLMRARSRVGLFAFLTAAVPLLSVMALSMLQYAANRYVFVSLGGWMLLAAIGAIELSRVSGHGGIRLLMAGALATLVVVPVSDSYLYYQYQSGNRDDWKAAFAYVEKNMEPGDLIVSADRQIANYYLESETVGMADLELEPLLESGSRIWFVEDLNVIQKWPWIHSWLVQNARLMADFSVHVQAREFTMNVYLYESGRSLDMTDSSGDG